MIVHPASACKYIINTQCETNKYRSEWLCQVCINKKCEQICDFLAVIEEKVF